MRRNPLRLTYFGLLAWTLALLPAWRWATTDAALLSFPVTPVQRVNARFDAEWRFLLEARHAVMPGSSYTVRAADLDDEMSLFMFSQGLCTRRTALPTSYYRHPLPEVGSRARYVLAFRDYTGGEQGLKFVVRLTNGTVYERSGRTP